MDRGAPKALVAAAEPPVIGVDVGGRSGSGHGGSAQQTRQKKPPAETLEVCRAEAALGVEGLLLELHDEVQPRAAFRKALRHKAIQEVTSQLARESLRVISHLARESLRHSGW